MISTSGKALCLGLALSGLTACSNDDDNSGDSDYQTQATLDVKSYVNGELVKLTKAASDIQAAAPAPDDDGWNADSDAKAVEAMRTAWGQARDSYEHIEGSIAVLFPGLDVSTDERYDGFLADGPDDNLFDDEGVVGVHGIERILWAGSAPERVVKFEETLDGYKPAEFPSTKQEADDFKNKLCALLVKDTTKMRDDFATVALDSSSAFRGMIGSMQEQSEKTTLAASGEDESRYAQRTLADMRANLDGAKAVFKSFKTWIDNSGKQSASIQSGFDNINTAYGKVSGPALPEVPASFNPDDPSDDDLATPYGVLWKLLEDQTNPDDTKSVVSIMLTAADDMKIPGLKEDE